jgi:predicted DNA repair protein MutK
MSGLLALLDDVAAIAKVAAASVDDVVGQAVKASSKAAGAVIDDAAVTPKYVHGFSADRELPIVWKIAQGLVLQQAGDPACRGALLLNSPSRPG